MTPESFISKWKISTVTERSGAQEQFIDLCQLLGQKTPNEADPDGVWYSFEKGLTKAGGGGGWADVWKRGCFAWEFKSKKKDLDAAFRQLQLYAPALEYPPLLIVSDVNRIIIHTAFTGMIDEVRVIHLDDLLLPDRRQWLTWAFTDPDRLKPGLTRAALTEIAASEFASLAQILRERGHESQKVAHFLNKLLFCFFAEDVDLLPGRLFRNLLRNAENAPQRIDSMLANLFQAMTTGGDFGVEVIDWFNGGLFDGNDVLPLNRENIRSLLRLAELDWAAIEPAIFGTLFERGLNPDKRSQLGAHYTDQHSIDRLIKPVIIEPLQDEWQTVKKILEAISDKQYKDEKQRKISKPYKQAIAAYQGFLQRLSDFRVLDPACGSGNFLYLALHALKDMEHRVMLEAEEILGIQRGFPQVGPEIVIGIELNGYAAELARTTVWIGEIQWMLRNGFGVNKNPILKPLENIAQRDALLNEDGTEAMWPTADVIIGNPPFLGDKRMRGELGDSYVETLRHCYEGRVPGGADLVTYWFEKARAQIENGCSKRAGLVATNSIRSGANRRIIEKIQNTQQIYMAFSDEQWINEGAAVRVSLIAFGNMPEGIPVCLDGHIVERINVDLTVGGANGIDITKAQPLSENKEKSFFGLCLAGPFDIPGDVARRWLTLPNSDGRQNCEVLRPLRNGTDILKTNKDRWVIDFGPSMTEAEASMYEAPFQYVLEHIKPIRAVNNNKSRAENWWILGRARPGLRAALTGLSRYIATVETAKHRIFVWLPTSVAPEHRLIVIPSPSDVVFGILSSRFHVVWVLAQGNTLEDRPVYNTGRCFDTFPFPNGITLDLAQNQFTNIHTSDISMSAQRLNILRERWQYPPEWTERLPEVVGNYPDRIAPKVGYATALQERTLTNLYNIYPAWLKQAHNVLDIAVANAYGWADYTAGMSDLEVLRRLLELNINRSQPQTSSERSELRH